MEGWVKAAASAMVVVAAACATDPVRPDFDGVQYTVAPGDTVQLRVGEAAMVTGHAVTVLFRGVSEDSRCPIDAVCIWQGDAVVQLDVARGRAAWQRLVLHTGIEPRAAVFGDVSIQLVAVLPARTSEADIRPGDYSVRLAFTTR